MINRHSYFLAAMVLALATPESGISVAQEDSTAGSLIEEIVVTARKREENELDVPIAISLVSGDDVRESNIVALEGRGLAVAHFLLSEGLTNNDNMARRDIVAVAQAGLDRGDGEL